ncbi:hypothetical protein TGAMA5MH_10414 [Trichoderma gamsii]|uniref:NADP-dependent oxidoreductase domain-containing protein n=1 Tax=Trichoderma gamsii TaxID=398673 RepID=A0A2K0SWI8_9HYPO|nr:hypothetical protein TGAMA5MH_10414 [Trichoderma gamsii]
MDIPLLPLCVGNQIPMLALGIGTAWFKEAGDTRFDQRPVDLIKKAIEKGFYHLDCSEIYGTEEEAGRAIQELGVLRKKLFITNKVDQGINNIPAAIEKSLEILHTNYFDLCVSVSDRQIDFAAEELVAVIWFISHSLPSRIPTTSVHGSQCK